MMKMLVVSRKIVLSIFIMLVVFGVENVGYSQDPYRPVNAIRVEAPGTMILGGVFYNAGCISANLNFNGVDYTFHSTKWQRRETAESPWVDVPGTQRTNEMCGFHAELPGEYRFVGEISINGVKGKRRSTNTFQIE